MKTLAVKLPRAPYEILIGPGLLDQAGELIRKVYKGPRAAVISDETVWSLYGSRLEEALTQAGLVSTVMILPPGETSKQMASYEQVCETLAANSLLRSDLIIAFGGGVIGDLAGFAAATYMRGLPYVQIPTTLLAQVDSAVGGKTAINLKQGKNLAGAFWQPRLVISDTALLATLVDREFAGGMAEVIKYAAIASPPLFKKLTAYAGKAGAYPHLAGIIYECCAIKAGLVEKDELDKGERMLLNFGHTFGHALEKMGDYSRYIHGEAVAIGMIIAATMGEKLGLHGPEVTSKLKSLIQSYGLPVKADLPFTDLTATVLLDKKNEDSAIRLILLEELGKAMIYPVTAENLKKEGGNGEWIV